MITVHVPATSANVGAGFDALGLALSLGNTVSMEEAEGCHIQAADGDTLFAGEDNMVYKAAKQLYELCGKPFSGLRMYQQSPIPLTRGLGSSSACIIAGLFGANVLLKYPYTRQQLLDVAAGMEGHPDNVAPALLGGLVAGCIEGERVHTVKKEISPTLCFAAFVPDFELPTKKARQALPGTIQHSDGVFNLSRAAVCQAAFCEGRLDLFPMATQDKLHQPYRMQFIPGGEEIFALARSAGALAWFISGAGPTILAVVEKRNEDFWSYTQAALNEAKKNELPHGRFAMMRLEADNEGARLV